jgi:autotransporter-associated beta strand protein
MHDHSNGFATMRGRLGLLLPLLIGGLTMPAHAQITNTWTGGSAPGNNNWSATGNWGTGGVPTSGAATGLSFTKTAATSNNDLGTNANPFQLNLMQFNVTAALTLTGNNLNFVSNGGTPPTLQQKSSAVVTIDNNLVLSNNLQVSMSAGGKLTLAGVISGASSLTLTTTTATYTTVLANSNNSYSGGTIIAGGTLQLGANNALTTGQDLTITNTGIPSSNTIGSTLDLHGFTSTVGNITFGDGTSNSQNAMTIADTGATAGLLTLNGNVTYAPGDNGSTFVTPTAYINANLGLAAGQHVFDYNGNGDSVEQSDPYDMIVTKTISGSGGIDLGVDNSSYAGMFLALAHANAYTGPTNIYNGSLYLGATNALPTNNAVTVGPEGNLYLYIANDYTESKLTHGSYNQTIGSLSDDGSSGGGNVYLGHATLTVGGNNASTTFSGIIADNDGFTSDTTVVGGSLVKVGTGTLTLGSNSSVVGGSTYTGSTTIDAGTLQLGINDALPDEANGVNATNLILNGGTLDTGGFSQNLNNVTNNGGTMLIQNSSNNSVIVEGTYTQSSGATQVTNSLLVAQSTYTQSGGTSQIDSSGTLTVSGAYKQSGGTTQVDGALNVTPGQNLSLTGGQLAGSGSIGNATSSGTITVTNSGGTVKPGDLLPNVTVATLTINGNYTQQSGGTLEIDLGGTTAGSYDVLKVSNAASLAGTLNLKLVNGFTLTPGTTETFDILQAGSITGNFTSITGLGTGDTPSFNNGVLTIQIAAVPETSTFLTAGLMLGAGGLLLRRQRKQDMKATAPAN